MYEYDSENTENDQITFKKAGERPLTIDTNQLLARIDGQYLTMEKVNHARKDQTVIPILLKNKIIYVIGNKTHAENISKTLIESFKIDNTLDTYQTNRLAYWLKTPQDGYKWMGNGIRNGAGYIFMPLIGVAGLVSLITCSALHITLHTSIGVAFSTFGPIGLGIALAIGIGLACIYLYMNRNKQIDNGFRLDYPETERPLSTQPA